MVYWIILENVNIYLFLMYVLIKGLFIKCESFCFVWFVIFVDIRIIGGI